MGNLSQTKSRPPACSFSETKSMDYLEMHRTKFSEKQAVTKRLPRIIVMELFGVALSDLGPGGI